MTAVNPGPASTSNSNTVAAITPVNAGGSSPQEQNQLRLLGAVKGINCAIAGDNVTRVLNSARWAPTAVAVVSSLGATQTPTTAYMGVWSGAGQTGVTVLASAVLTNPTLVQMQYAAAANTTSVTTDQYLYVNIGSTTANGVIDVLVYGYDLST